MAQVSTARAVSAEGIGGDMCADRTEVAGGPADPSAGGAGRAPSRRLAVSLREAAEMLGVSAKTIRREIMRGRLKGLKVGAQWRVRTVEIEGYLVRRERQGGR